MLDLTTGRMLNNTLEFNNQHKVSGASSQVSDVSARNARVAELCSYVPIVVDGTMSMMCAMSLQIAILPKFIIHIKLD